MFPYPVLVALLGLVLVICVGDVESVRFVKDENLDERLQVTTFNGIVQGRVNKTTSGRRFLSFRGIPYARPPVGNLRFRAPKSAEPWQGVLDATQQGQTCVEIFLRGNGVFTAGKEDCLFLNIFAPLNSQTTNKSLPVLVWIHGGAFIEGNSSEIMYGPEFLLEEDIMVVTLNYRTGLIGFLSTEDSASPGNYGLKDQALALRWVQRNIRNFGGDPSRVTIFGQSAGAASVLYHMVSPKSKGLFQRAIANSGSSISGFARTRDARDTAFKVGSGVGINAKSSKELVAKLRMVDLEELNSVSKTIIILGAVNVAQQGFPFGPVIERRHKDAFIFESSYDSLESGSFNRVPILMGITSAEAVFFKTLIRTIKPFTILYDLSPSSLPNPSMNIDSFEKRREVGNEIRRHYFRSGSALEAPIEEIEDLVSDDQFLRPIRKTAQFISKFAPVFFYVFSYRSTYGISGFDDEYHGLNRGVVHAEDLTYLWKEEGNRESPTNPTDKLMVARMVRLWTNFAKTANPTPKRDQLLDNISWPPMDSSRDLKYLNIDSQLSLKSNYREEHMRFWDYLYDKYGGKSYVTY